MPKRLTLTEMQALMTVLTQLLSAIEETAVKASRAHAIVELRYIFDAFQASQYFNKGGGTRPVAPYGRKWGQVKRRRHWDLRPGWATGRLGRAVGNPSVIRPTAKGYRLDLSRPDKVVRRYTSRGHPNSFVTRKAPGLMNMKRGYKERHEKAIRKAVRPLIKQLRQVSAEMGIDAKTVRMNVALRLDPVLEAAAKQNRFGKGGRLWRRTGLVQNRNKLGQFQGVRGFRYSRKRK